MDAQNSQRRILKGRSDIFLDCSFAHHIIRVACAVNIMTALSMSELNALMPNLTGGLAQYTLACMGPFAAIISMVGGYLVCNTICGSVECAMFGNTMNSVFHTGLPSNVFCVILLVI